MKRLIFTVVLLVTMAACCVPVYAASKSRLVFDHNAFESVPASLDGEYVYSVEGDTEEREAFDFTVTVVREDGKITEMTSTAPDGFMQIENYSGDKWWWKDIPFGDYLIREVACPDAAKLYKLETTDVSVEKEDDISVENASARFSIEKRDVELNLTYRLRHDSPAISVSTEVLHPYAGLEGARTLFFGGESWIVIAYKSLRGESELLKYKDDSLYPQNSVTLLKSNVTEEDKIQFNQTDDCHSYTNCYGWRYDSKGKLIQPEKPSTLREFIENTYIGGFSAAEQAAIMPRILEGGGIFTTDNSENRIRGEGVGDAMFWPLSIREADLVRVQKRTDYDWWLRTPGKDGSKAQYAGYDGNNEHLYGSGIEVNNREICARPAFYLNIGDESAVIMTSAVSDGKESGKEGPDALTEVETKEYTEWKVTVKSDELKGFKVDQVESCNGDNLCIKYSGAVYSSEGNSFISAVIVNGDDVKYYGRIKALTSEDDETGEVLINLKGKVDKAAGDKICIFNELFNGNIKKTDGKTVARTDYASDLVEVAIPPESDYKHDYEDATCTVPKTCVRCGATDGKALGHSFTKYVSNHDATATEDGTKTAKCDRCDATDTVVDKGTATGQLVPLDLKNAASGSGNGWVWDSASRTLTLSGMTMDLSKYAEDFDAAIMLPDEGATIVVNDKLSTIKVPGGKTKSAEEYSRLAVETGGSLTIVGDGVGVLSIEATGGANGIGVDGNVTIGDKNTLKGPAVEVYGSNFGIYANKAIGVFGSTLEAGNTESNEERFGAVIAANLDKEPGGIIVDHSDVTVSAAGSGSAGLAAIYGDLSLMDSSFNQTPVDGASEVDGLVTANGTVNITNSQAYFDLGTGDKAGGSIISAEYDDESLQTNRDIYIKDSTVRGLDADTGLYAYFGGATIINSTVDLTTAGYTIDCNYKGLTVSGSTVDLRSTGDYFAGCARVGGPLSIKDSTFTAKASGEMGSGISFNYSSGKAVFSGKNSKISLEGTYAAISFNDRKNSKDYPLTLKNNLTDVSGGKLQAVYDASDKSYTWSYSASTLKAGKDGIMKNASKKVSFAAGKANTLKVSGKTYKIKAKSLKKKSRTVKRAKVLKVKGAKGDVRYTKVKGNKKITINYKTGKVTLKKGLKKGKYKVTVKVFAAGNSKYGQAKKKATFKIVVK